MHASTQYVAKGTIIETSRGGVRVEDITVEDKVAALDDATNSFVPIAVRSITSLGERPMRKVQVGAMDLIASPKQKGLTARDERRPGRQRARYKQRWIPLVELSKGNPVAVSKILPDMGSTARLANLISEQGEASGKSQPIRVPTKTSPALLWWLGLYLGDGYVHHGSKTKARAMVAIPATDDQLRQHLIQTTWALFRTQGFCPDEYRVQVGATELCRLIYALGFSGKALTKRIPEWVYGLSMEERLAFVAGYIDSDGGVRAIGDAQITSANKELLQQTQHLLRSVGVRYSRIIRFTGPHPTDPERTMVGYRLCLSGDLKRVPLAMERKAERTLNKTRFRSGRSVGGMNLTAHMTDEYGYDGIRNIYDIEPQQAYAVELMRPLAFVAEGLLVSSISLDDNDE